MPHDKLPKKPENYERMLGLAEKLSNEMCFLRVDLYEIKGKIYFSELTFFPCAGLLPFEPKQWDKTLGEWITLPEKKGESNEQITNVSE